MGDRGERLQAMPEGATSNEFSVRCGSKKRCSGRMDIALRSHSGGLEFGHCRIWRFAGAVLETAVNGGADALVTFNRRDFGKSPARFAIDLLLPKEVIERIMS